MYKKHLLSLAILALSSTNILAGNLGFDSGGVTAETDETVGSAPDAHVANNDFDSVIVGLKPVAKGNVTGNDLNGDFVAINSSATGTYGFITLESTGQYTYTLYDNAINAALQPNQVVTDTFDYLYTKNSTAKSIAAHLSINVTGGQTLLTANDDFVSFVFNKDIEITGNVISNDSNGLSVRLNTTPVSQYGILVLNSDGNFTYSLHKNTSVEISNLRAGEVVLDSFEYVYTNQFKQTVKAQLVIQIVGNVTEVTTNPDIIDDNITLVVNKDAVIRGSVSARGNIGNNVLLKSSPASDYGYLVLNADHTYTYTLYEDAPAVLALKVREVATDTFEYIYLDENVESKTAKLTVTIIGNPVDKDGNTVFELVGADNVDIEFNDRAEQATPLNSARNIKGHLHEPGDKDWYSISSAGNEIITLEMCPQGSSCFDKGSWVLYVFDSDKLTKEMQEKTVSLNQTTIESTGTVSSIVTIGNTNHMYSAYEAGHFDGALIGIIDPCFDTNNTVSIGVGDGERNYLIAVSSTLRGGVRDKLENLPADSCGTGSTILREGTEYKRVETSVAGVEKVLSGEDSEGNPTFIFVDKVVEKEFEITVLTDHIEIFPNSDDQYTVNITGTGIHPLLSPQAATRSSTFNLETGELNIPKIRVLNDLYQINLNLQASDTVVRRANKDKSLKFDLSAINLLGNENPDAYQATYNPDNNEVLIPRVTDINSGNAYSIILKYHAATDSAEQWLELINATEIK